MHGGWEELEIEPRPWREPIRDLDSAIGENYTTRQVGIFLGITAAQVGRPVQELSEVPDVPDAPVAGARRRTPPVPRPVDEGGGRTGEHHPVARRAAWAQRRGKQ